MAMLRENLVLPRISRVINFVTMATTEQDVTGMAVTAVVTKEQIKRNFVRIANVSTAITSQKQKQTLASTKPRVNADRNSIRVTEIVMTTITTRAVIGTVATAVVKT